MCGRFYISEDLIDGFVSLGLDINERVNDSDSGVIYPSNNGLILNHNDSLELDAARWGFPLYNSSKLVINSRSETIEEKRMFKKPFLNSRIVICMSAFYEWNELKEKYTFSRSDSDILYVAGIYDIYDNIPSFSMLTTQANDSMIDIHDRMPLVLEESMVKDWIYDLDKARDLLKYEPVQLEKSSDYEQQSFL